jgi:hypothetical protein
MGPVMFVFDVSDTAPEKDAPPLPEQVEHPFEICRGRIRDEFEMTVENAKRDGVSVAVRKEGSQRAGSIECVKSGQRLSFLVKQRPQKEYVLAHLYCGHLGTPNEKWWQDRTGLPRGTQEFEAESICYLVCHRLGIENPSEKYLASYLKENPRSDVPEISFERVMKSAGLIEQMGRERLKARKEKE